MAQFPFHEIGDNWSKCQWYDGKLILADRWYASSQICSDCQTRHKMKHSQRVFECSCGNRQCQDFNVSIDWKTIRLIQSKFTLPATSSLAARLTSIVERRNKHQSFDQICTNVLK